MIAMFGLQLSFGSVTNAPLATTRISALYAVGRYVFGNWNPLYVMSGHADIFIREFQMLSIASNAPD